MDSNVLLDVFEADPQWFDWSADTLERLSEDHDLVINPIVYAEVSVGFARIEELERALQAAGLRYQELPREALFLAGKAFLAYRRAGGPRGAPLPDFFIGAHAAVARFPLLTRDQGRYRTYFSKLQLIAPE